MCHLDYVFINLDIKEVYNLVTYCECDFNTWNNGVEEVLDWRSSDLEPGQMPKTSSRNREYRSGWIWKEFMAAWSNF